MDTEINRCKSAFKLKQYMSCGVPVLASPVGENPRFLEHGGNGFLCRTVEEFRQCVYRVAGVSDADYNALCQTAFRSTRAFDQEQYAKAFLAACRELKAFQPTDQRHRKAGRDQGDQRVAAKGTGLVGR